MTNQLTLSASLLLLVTGLSACGGDGDTKPHAQGGSAGSATGGKPTTGGASGASGASSGASNVGGSVGHAETLEPLLDRPLMEAYDCEASRAVTISAAPKAQAAVLGPRVPEGNLIAFASGFLPQAQTEAGLFAAIFSSDGTIGSAVRISQDPNARVPEIVEQGDHSTLLWVQSRPTGAGYDAIWSAQVDSSASIVRPAASTMEPLEDRYVNDIRGAKNGDEVRIFLTMSEPATGRSRIASAPLSAYGSLASPLETVIENAGPIMLFDVVDFAGGYALGYGYYEDGKSVGRYVALDASLARRHPPVDIAMGPFGIWGDKMDLLARGDEILMSKVGGESSDAGRTATYVEFSAYDQGGNAVGETERLQAPVFDVENSSPRFMMMGDDLGFSWSNGTFIYACAGCTPDNALKFVVLDGASLRPKSKVVEFQSPDPDGGLIDGELSGSDGTFLLLTNVQYHVTSSMATGRLSCSMK